jgi:ribokinase
VRIFARGLAQLFARLRHIKNVVDHLEGQADALAKRGERRDLRGGRVCAHRSETNARREQGGGLAPVDVLEFCGGERAAFPFEIGDLSADEPAAARGMGEFGELRGGRVTRGPLGLGENLKSDGEQGIAGEDSDAFAKYFVIRRPAAAEVVVVHAWEVIMHERVSVNALHGARGGQRALRRPAASFGRREREHRAQPLAAGEKRVAHRLVNRGRLRGRFRQETVKRPIDERRLRFEIPRQIHVPELRKEALHGKNFRGRDLARRRRLRFVERMRVVVVGSSNTDLVVHSSRLPRPGETILGGEFRQFAGGKGANQAVAAARAGAEVTFVGARGDDAFGASAKAALRAEGVNTRFFVEKAGCSSGVALILVGGRDRENLIAVAKSANDTLTPLDVRAAEPAIRRARVVVAQLEVPIAAVVEAARLAAEHGIPFILNPAPARPLPVPLFRRVRILVPNEEEAALLANRHAVEKDSGSGLPAAFARRHRKVIRDAGALRARGCENVAITLGARGVLLAQQDQMTWIRGKRVTPLDTVGAGDCFTAWLAVAIAEGRDLVSASERASRAAAISVTRHGAQAGMPFREEVP